MTLTQVSILTKQLIILIIISLALGIGLFIGYQIWYTHYLQTKPAVEEKPTTDWGVLPATLFPPGNVSSSNFTYNLDTATGNLPVIGKDPMFSKIIKVYFVTKTYASLLSSEKSQELAAKFDIFTQPQILSDTEYQFTQDQKKLEINLDSGNFVYTSEASVSAEEKLDEDNQLIAGFERILTSLGILKPNLNLGKKEVKLLTAVGGEFTPTQVRAVAQAAQISLWPEDIDQKPILTPDFNKSLIKATVYKSANDLKNYLSLQFIFWPIDLTTSSTYPLKNPQLAFDDLRSGKGVVIIEPNKSQVSITSVYLAYFMSKDYSPYLQPIYVFEGPQFVAFVPAIDSVFIKNE